MSKRSPKSAKSVATAAPAPSPPILVIGARALRFDFVHRLLIEGTPGNTMVSDGRLIVSLDGLPAEFQNAELERRIGEAVVLAWWVVNDLPPMHQWNPPIVWDEHDPKDDR